MDRLTLQAEEREVLGKKVKKLRKQGFLPGHVFGHGVLGENVLINLKDFLKVYHQVGETGLIDLKIGLEKVRPVMVKGAQHNARDGAILHVDFYQVNLKEKVRVPVPIVLKEVLEEIESVKMGEAVILQVLGEVEVEALPTDLIEHIEVDILSLKNVDDAITLGMLNYDRSKLTILAEPDEVVVKLAPAVTEEMKALLEEQEAEVAAAQEAVEGEEEAEKVEGEEDEEEEAKVEEGKEEGKEGEDEKKEE